jgi:guanylate kinase
LLPPSISILKKRLLKRHFDNKLLAISRLSSARKDLKHWDEYDFVYVNDNLNSCVAKICKKINDLVSEKNKILHLKQMIKKL